jgi:hypothetical protein
MRPSKPDRALYQELPPCLSSAEKLREIEFTQWRSSAEGSGSVISPNDAKGEPTWCSVTLSFEHMAEVTPTGSTDDLGAFPPKRNVHVAGYSARDGWIGDQSITARDTLSYYRRKRLASRSRC